MKISLSTFILIFPRCCKQFIKNVYLYLLLSFVTDSSYIGNVALWMIDKEYLH